MSPEKQKPFKHKAFKPKVKPGKRTDASAATSKKKPLRSVKNQIRSVNRSLKADIPLKAREKARQKLEELEALLTDHQNAERARQYAVRYHKIRFFERVKLERRIKQLQSNLSKVSEAEKVSVEELNKELVQAKEDLQYVQYFPPWQKYVSILKQASTSEEQASLDKSREVLRALAKQRRADEALVAEPDEGASLHAAAAEPQSNAGPDPFANLLGEEGDHSDGEASPMDYMAVQPQKAAIHKQKSELRMSQPASHTHHKAGESPDDGARRLPAANANPHITAAPRSHNAVAQVRSPSDKSQSWNALPQKRERPSSSVPPQVSASGKPRQQKQQHITDSAANSPTVKLGDHVQPARPSRKPHPGQSLKQAKPGSALQPSSATQPQRTRAEGGRKRRRK